MNISRYIDTALKALHDLHHEEATREMVFFDLLSAPDPGCCARHGYSPTFVDERTIKQSPKPSPRFG